ncbi:MAG: hypothetical protein ACJA0U_001366 [Salibacteraceae bacterium]|jgi:hypothetical protein
MLDLFAPLLSIFTTLGFPLLRMALRRNNCADPRMKVLMLLGRIGLFGQ